jgi:predicted DNA-binding transcriptional regulator AlpA
MNHVISQHGRARTDISDRRTQPTTPGRGDLGMAAAMQKLWSTQELADFLGLPIQTIYQWRKRNYGPTGRKMGRHIRYRPSEVERWISSLDGRAA